MNSLVFTHGGTILRGVLHSLHHRVPSGMEPQLPTAVTVTIIILLVFYPPPLQSLIMFPEITSKIEYLYPNSCLRAYFLETTSWDIQHHLIAFFPFFWTMQRHWETLRSEGGTHSSVPEGTAAIVSCPSQHGLGYMSKAAIFLVSSFPSIKAGKAVR